MDKTGTITMGEPEVAYILWAARTSATCAVPLSR
jgi:cation transport ATPase